jgi:ribosomal protein L11 methyltransferase
MKRQALWSLSIIASDKVEGATAELLTETFGQPASIYSDLRTGKSTVSVYLPIRPLWSKAARKHLTQALQKMGPGGRDCSSEIKLTRLQPKDWAESWKKHFRPLEIGRKLLIKPSWSRKSPKPGQAEVVLDPGMSFGTGQHPTTSFCLQELVRIRNPIEKQSFLDVGTGSGILAISAAKLGYEPVSAFDVDPAAIKIARANAWLNKVSGVRFECVDLVSLPNQPSRQYSVICANLMANLLLAEKRRLLGLLKNGGVLTISGILKTEFGQVQAAYEAAGLRMARSMTKGEWRSGSFV